MRYRTLGRTGFRVSELAVGCAPFGMSDYIRAWDATTDDAQRQITEVVHRAVDLGYNYFDTAPAYGKGRSEEMLGIALKGVREGVLVATKLGSGRSDVPHVETAWSPLAIRESVEGSLRRMQLDTLDVIQFHGGDYSDGGDHVILEQGGLETVHRLREEGKIRYIGFATEGISGGVERLIASGAFDIMQVCYNLMNQRASDFEKGHGIIRQADAQGIGVVVMRPLTGGVFMRLMASAFPEIAPDALGTLLLNYVLSDPYIDTALVGTRSPARLASNNAISDDVASRLYLEDLHQYFLRRRKA